jgi:PAS domain S-box-containing protein
VPEFESASPDADAVSYPGADSSQGTALLDTPAEESFDRLTRLAARLTGAPASFISLVHADSELCKRSYGFLRPQGACELDGTTFCQFSVREREPLVVPDTRADARLRDIPPIESRAVRAYLGVQLSDAKGKTLGSLCVIDFQTRDWTSDDVELITEVALLIQRELDFRTALRDSELLRAELARRARASELNLAAGTALIAGGPLDHTLSGVAQAIVDYLDAAFARIWVLNETEQVLELRASAGQYTHLNGPHSRIAVGDLKIGKIAQDLEPQLTNDVQHDPRISDHAWARREGMVSFAGYPLLVGERAVGVMAMFARHPLGAETLDAFKSVADAVALAIEQGRTRQALLQRERQFETLANSIPQLAWMADAGGHIFWYNRRSSEYTGMTLADLRHGGWRKLYRPEQVDRVIAGYLRAMAAGEPWEDTFEIRGASGDYGWFLGRAVPIRDENGQILQWFGTNTDITAERRSEDRLRGYANQAQEALKERDEVLAVVSHDLRNPLNTIAMAASLLCEVDMAPEKRRHQLESIQRAATMMDGLIQDLLDVSKAEESGLQLELQEENIPPIVREVVDSFALTAGDQGVELTREIQTDIPRIKVDRGRLSQVLSNLIGNALQFTRRGGRVTLRLERRHTELLFSVSDTGEGIAEPEMDRVFDRFWQAKKTKRGGAGLGLAICKAVVQAHGGRIWVESQKGKGSTFYFTLPINGVATRPSPPESR